MRRIIITGSLIMLLGGWVRADTTRTIRAQAAHVEEEVALSIVKWEMVDKEDQFTRACEADWGRVTKGHGSTTAGKIENLIMTAPMDDWFRPRAKNYVWLVEADRELTCVGVDW
jgi:hypothetical protein